MNIKWKKDIEENVRSGIVELLILQLLCERDMYGYEIRKMLAERTNNAFEIKEASLYGPLYRMSDRGLISSYKKMAGEKRFRMYYQIEDAGRQYLSYGKEQINFVFSGAMELLNWKGESNE
jgi:PadR family transcriptional regulator PadR